MSPDDDEIEKLKAQVSDLTQLVGFLATAVDGIAQNQAVMTDTVGNLVDAQGQSMETQEKIVLGINSLQEMVRQLLPPPDEG
jgi:hypothetical protein